jgi:hypothetical protein
MDGFCNQNADQLGSLAEIQELEGKQDVCSRLCKGNVLIDC